MRISKQPALCAAIACLLLSFVFAVALQAEPLSGKVERIYDGDTVRVAGIGKVRLLGIDAPERKASERDRFYAKRGVSPHRLRQIAEDARRFTTRMSKGQTVRLTFDSERRDDYGRLLAYVHLPDGRLLNRLLLEQGYAAVYRRADFRLKDDFFAAEAAAKEKKLGLWQ
ncbi:MAG: thermonuclease family protein [Desulfuromonadales bacterium]